MLDFSRKQKPGGGGLFVWLWEAVNGNKCAVMWRSIEFF